MRIYAECTFLDRMQARHSTHSLFSQKDDSVRFLCYSEEVTSHPGGKAVSTDYYSLVRNLAQV